MVLKYLNLFSREAESRTLGIGLRVDFSKEESDGRRSGFFTENGRMGMLEAPDYNAINKVLPFFGEIIYTCCVNFIAPET